MRLSSDHTSVIIVVVFVVVIIIMISFKNQTRFIL